jgi:ADP-ribose pyrophosphatase YjhB (NUDIX family)
MELRRATRCVIFDKDDNVALVHFSVHDFYKVPGGGIDDGEEILDALKRECLEEAGVHIEDITLIGTVTEIKKGQKRKQISYCYKANVAGEKKDPAMTEEENEAGALLQWMPIAQAIQKLQKSGFKNLGGKYIYQRELAILNACI